MFKSELGKNDSYSITTLLVCNNVIARAGLTQILSEAGFTPVDTLEAMPFLCVVDASQPSETVLETVRAIKSHLPLSKVALLGNDFDIDFVRAAFSAAVDGFCSISSEREVLLKSLELIALGEKILPGALVQLLLSQAATGPRQGQLSSAAPQSSPDPRFNKLSPREKEILQSLMGGDANKVIARKLDITEATIKVHVKAILRKIGAANRTQAAMWASGNLAELDQTPNDTTQSHGLR
jgi:two-component system nitrate/nitrite response regulator NarL